MKKVKHNRSFLHAGRLVLLALTLSCPLLKVQAQGYFVLTNGYEKWYLNHYTDERAISQIALPDTLDPLGNQVWVDFLVNGIPATDTTLNTYIGDKYVKLDISNPEDPQLTTTGTFDPKCAWYRTNYIGYYYQEWDGYRYYLVGSSLDGMSLRRVAVGEEINDATSWYDWDFGAAFAEPFVRNGFPGEAYYWFSFQGDDLVVSCESYERPEMVQFLDSAGSFKRYACGPDLPDDPEYTGVLVSPLQRIYHGKEIVGRVGGAGLSSVNLGTATLSYGENTTATANITEGYASVRDPYYEFVEERQRKGINTNWRNRSTNTLGSAGTLISATYLYNAALTGTIGAVPEPENEALVLDHITYTLNNSARRYLSVTPALDGRSAAINCISRPSETKVARLTVIAFFDNGTSDTIVKNITISTDYDQPPVNPVNAPVVRGSVFGGGRMADVTGNTVVGIYQCDTVGAVFGGNDISGRVLGNDGAVITLGGSTTNATTAVHIGSVYGGGNGYYNYESTTSDAEFVEGESQPTTFKGDVWLWNRTGDGNLVESDLASGSYIPDIKRARIYVTHANVTVDSLFGGAKNAFLSGYAGSDNVVEIVHSNGTVFAEFGGNNYGGTLAAAKNISITVSGTTTTLSQDVTNTYFAGFGRDFGIRYLFGGGNKVSAPAVVMNITGGMVDTCFAGGNSATVTSTSCTVDCGTTIFDNSTTGSPSTWVGGRGRYNVRCLFGGNNQAAMAVLPTLTLTRGGIGTVYGGGNAGDMNYDGALPGGITTPFTEARGIHPPTKVSTYVLVNSANMYIDYLYGGCQMANVKTSTFVDVRAGNLGTIFGGCNISGDVGTSTTANYGTYVVMQGSPVVYANVFAGSNGFYHCNNDGMYVSGINFKDNAGNIFDTYEDYIGGTYIPTHNSTNLLLLGGTVNGNVYGGGNMANVGFERTTFPKAPLGTSTACPANEGAVHLTMENGHVLGNMFGGGNMAYIFGLSYLRIRGTSQIDGSLFAGNDRVGRIVASFGKYLDWNGNPLNASDGTALNNASSVDYSAYVLLEGTPTIGDVYGGGNGAYNYNGTDKEEELYGSQIEFCNIEGFHPKQPSSFIDIHTSGGSINRVFGGGNGVGVENKVVVLLNTSAGGQYVNTIFGGNNRDDMSCVPWVHLWNGQVGDVYGGCNLGNMTGFHEYSDICGNNVRTSTYVLMDNAAAEVTGNIYGGCNQADVTDASGTTFVDIRDGSVQSVFGGNNISGTVSGNTRVDISGGTVQNVYGGSNGYYDYVEFEQGVYHVYTHGAAHIPANSVADRTTGWPNVENGTHVNIFGGLVEGDVYGGGRMGDCTETYVVVDDHKCYLDAGAGTYREATITGVVYGGGEGEYTNLHLPRHGNVNGATHVDLYHAKSLSGAKAYGGGRGGDVHNTYITAHENWDKPFEALYGGCWGSDVYGTTHLVMNGSDIGDYNVRTLFGGNDFTGNVYKADVQINSGLFENIYGAGDGVGDGIENYELKYQQGPYAEASKHLYAPNTEYVELTFNGGTVHNNLYGGGRLGTTFAYQKDAQGGYVLDGNNRKVADTLRTKATTVANPEDFSYIIVNMHGGTIYKDIVTGAAGSSVTKKQLVYGLKVLNMDGGEVRQSLYGGSENVSDGYPHECDTVASSDPVGTKPRDKSTMRPSTIMNITGGEIRNHFFGGGYFGLVYGSVYINLGLSAIDSCVAYTNTYGGTPAAYAAFKPGAAGGHCPALVTNDLMFDASIYSGANWGENAGAADFTVRGFVGGESRIFIDGKGYNTTIDDSNPDPWFDIKLNVIGSGTSANGGDILSAIEIHNYGVTENDGEDCVATKEIKSIQRTDSLWLHNTAIHFTGAADATNAHEVTKYTFFHVRHMNMRGYNLAQLSFPATQIHTLSFWEDERDGEGNWVLVNNQDLAAVTQANGTCSSTASRCNQLGVIDPNDPDKRHTVMFVDAATNIEVSFDTVDAGGNPIIEYGIVSGFGYLLAPATLNATVTARAKLPADNDAMALAHPELHTYDGGFIMTCDTNNKYLNTAVLPRVDGVPVYSADDPLSWLRNEALADREMPYTNFTDVYRVWTTGNGTRRRYTSILAHANPHELSQYDKSIIVPVASGDHRRLAVAKGQLLLPPTDPGHFYKLSTRSFELKGVNEPLHLVDSAWMPTDWDVLSDSIVEAAALHPDTVSKPGVWKEVELKQGYSSSLRTGTSYIFEDPISTFGLVINSSTNFAFDGSGQPMMPEDYDTCFPYSVISGNPYVNSVGHFCTAKVGSTPNASPILDLFLTYSNNFSSTFVGSVSFVLDEYDEDGNNLQSPIEIVVNISTIVKEFSDITQTVMAMNNEGRTNKFVRKAVLPATMQHRELYLTDIKWMPTENDGTEDESSELFYLVGDEATVTGATPPEVNNLFCLNIIPSDNLSATAEATAGWHTIDTSVNLYTFTNQVAASKTSALEAGVAASVSMRNPGNENRGVKLGELDGRGLAVLLLELTYDGNRLYTDPGGKGYVGKAVVGLQSYVAGEPVDEGFNLIINVKTRDHGDTIYLASADSVVRGSYKVKPVGNLMADNAGKRPDLYVTNFRDALNDYIYEEGDVIAIIDTVKIEDNLMVSGLDYASLPIIRYTGHNSFLPGEESVYRGPMIIVSGEGVNFTMKCVDLDGGAVGKKWNGSEKVNDTNLVYGPVIMVKDKGDLSFGQNATIKHNWNGYDGGNARDKGAISITSGGIVSMYNNVEIGENITLWKTGDDAIHPLNGAVYIDGGKLHLGSSNKSTAIDITRNYLFPTLDDPEPTVDYPVWWTNYPLGSAGAAVKRWMIDTNTVKLWTPANVFLTRTAAAGSGDVPIMKDSKSDMLLIDELIPANTRIGISKWFPGPTMRDTIAFATATGTTFTHLKNALQNNNFISDDGHRILYNRGVSTRLIYLHRCATFKHQEIGEDLPFTDGVLAADSVLQYVPLPGALCPIGGDMIVYRVQGGFFPYTYTWDGPDGHTTVTEGSNMDIMSQIASGNYDGYASAIADTLVTSHINMTHYQNTHSLQYVVTVTDAGNCELKKKIDVTLRKLDELNPTPFVVVNDETHYDGFDDPSYDGWTATDTVHTAKANRNYKAISVTPEVWVDRNAGTIQAMLSDNDSIFTEDGSGRHKLESMLFCAGDTIKLATASKSTTSKFIMWDFAPYYTNPVVYVIPPEPSTVVAYYGPVRYWIDTISTTEIAHAAYDENYNYGGPSGKSYVTTYNGDVHIYDERGLAWFISVVNGLNGTQARPFYFNKVFLHKKSGGDGSYDMQNFLWTPVGTIQHRFRGWFIGTSNTATDTARLAKDDYVVIKNIIVDEPNLENSGFFAWLDTARVSGVKLQGALVRGSQYVGTLAARSVDSKIDNCAVVGSTEGAESTTILTTHHTSGGLVGRSERDSIVNITVSAKYVGDAVYSGGVIGYGESSKVYNTGTRNYNRMNGLYLGGVAGWLDGTAPGNTPSSKGVRSTPAIVANNYVHFFTNGESQRVGGVVGYARNSIIENNYVYGHLEGTATEAGMAAVMDEGTEGSYNYYEQGSVDRTVGQQRSHTTLGISASFVGKGNQVQTSETVYGVNNLTRALNFWVRNHGNEFSTWRSDMEDHNYGYPMFGTPDLIPVHDEIIVEGCDSIEWDNFIYTSDATLQSHVIDSVMLVDSTTTLHLLVHHSTREQYTDSTSLGEAYVGHGFYVSEAETELLSATVQRYGYATLVLTDTLSSNTGCDSIVTLNLLVQRKNTENIDSPLSPSHVNVYPNPTTSMVTIEATGLRRVELYDNEGRRLQYYTASDDNSMTVNVSSYPTGVYYLRVHSSEGVTIQKLIKK